MTRTAVVLDEALREVGETVTAALPGAVTGYDIAFGELTITAEAGRLLEVMTLLRDDPGCRFVQFIDLCGVDWPAREKRFDVVYHLLSPHEEPPGAGQGRDRRGDAGALDRAAVSRAPAGSSARPMISTASCSRATPTCVAS